MSSLSVSTCKLPGDKLCVCPALHGKEINMEIKFKVRYITGMDN